MCAISIINILVVVSVFASLLELVLALVLVVVVVVVVVASEQRLCVTQARAHTKARMHAQHTHTL